MQITEGGDIIDKAHEIYAKHIENLHQTNPQEPNEEVHILSRTERLQLKHDVQTYNMLPSDQVRTVLDVWTEWSRDLEWRFDKYGTKFRGAKDSKEV